MVGKRQASTRRALVLPAAALVLAVAAPIGLDSAGASPTSPTRPVPASNTAPSGPHLPLQVRLLGVQVSVDVPLSVHGLLHSTASPTSVPPVSSVPPVTSVPPPVPTTSVTPPPTRPVSRPSSRTATQRPTSPATTVVAAPVRPRPATSHPSRPATSVVTPAPTRRRPEIVEVAGTVLSALVPTSLARVLYLLTVLGALGLAALVIRMGRRGGRV